MRRIIITAILLLLLLKCEDNTKEFTIWIGGAPQEIEFWQNKINYFRDSTGINIKLVRQPTYSDQRRQSLIIALQSRQSNPDLFLMDGIWVNQFYRSGWLVPLDPYITKSEINKSNIFFEKAIDEIDRYNDTLYALPVFMDVALLYYRKDLLEKYGIKTPPQTWNDLIQSSKKITAKEENLNGFVWQGAQYEGLVCVFLEFLKSNGGKITIDERKINLHYQENITALQLMQDLIHKYRISPQNIYTEMKEEEVRRSFQNGNAAFERNWTYAAKLHALDGSQVKNKFGIALLPHSENESSFSTMGGWHVGLSKYSDVKDEAWKFIEYITSYKFQKEMIMEIGWNPVRKDVYNDEDVIKEMPYVDIMEEALNNAAVRPNVPYYPQVSEIIQRNVNKCLSGNVSASNAIAQMQSKINELTDIYE